MYAARMLRHEVTEKVAAPGRLPNRQAALIERGKALADLLAGSWRTPAAASSCSAAVLAELVPLLDQAGCAGLGWWRMRHASGADAAPAQHLRRIYRQQAIGAAVYGETVRQSAITLQSAGVDPLFFKGWAIARLYPTPGLRPCGDIDLCVRPEEYSLAMEALQRSNGGVGLHDLHRGFSPEHLGFSLLNDGELEEIYDHAERVTIGDRSIRILGPEDHLRLLCFHMFGHGAWRALWLCDVAVALESRPPAFDWDRCLRGDRRRADWVACALGLAHALLGARIEDTPVAQRGRNLPRWLVPTVLQQWGQGYRALHQMAPEMRRPLRALQALPRHWRNPIQGTVEVGGPFNDWPRLPFQLAACARRAAHFMAELPAWQRTETARERESDP